MEQWKKKFGELGDRWFEGELTIPKTELWLVLTACFLMGILYGLKKAPMTHGVMIGSNNGNSWGGCRDHKGASKGKHAAEAGSDGVKEACECGGQHKKHKCHKKSCCR